MQMNYFKVVTSNKSYSWMSSIAFRACCINCHAPLKVASTPCLPLAIQAPDQMSPPLRDVSWPPSLKYNHHPKKTLPPSLSLSCHLVCITSHPHLVTGRGRQGFCLIGHCFPKCLKQHQAHSMRSVIRHWMDEWQFLETSPSHLEPSPEKNVYNWGQKHVKE